MMKKFSWLVLPFVLIGCSTPTPKTPRAFTDQEQQIFFKRAKVPQVFGITVYASDNGPIFAGANRVHEGQWANMSFLSSKDSLAPIVSLEPGGPGKFTALVDTSSKDSWLSSYAANEANIIPIGPPAYIVKPSHVADDMDGDLSVAPTIHFNVLNLETVLFYVRAAHGPMGPLARSNDPEPDAVIGYNLLKSFAFAQFHFSEKQLRLSATKAFTPNKDALIAAIPITEVNGSLAVEGVIDGKSQLLIIDTGGDFALAMKEAPAEPIRQVSMGDIVFRQVTATRSTDTGLDMLDYPRIGRKLLSKFIITICPKEKILYAERPANAPRPKSMAAPSADKPSHRALIISKSNPSPLILSLRGRG